jgi:hypothetical protein
MKKARNMLTFIVGVCPIDIVASMVSTATNLRQLAFHKRAVGSELFSLDLNPTSLLKLPAGLRQLHIGNGCDITSASVQGLQKHPLLKIHFETDPLTETKK